MVPEGCCLEPFTVAGGSSIVGGIPLQSKVAKSRLFRRIVCEMHVSVHDKFCGTKHPNAGREGIRVGHVRAAIGKRIVRPRRIQCLRESPQNARRSGFGDPSSLVIKDARSDGRVLKQRIDGAFPAFVPHTEQIGTQHGHPDLLLGAPLRMIASKRFPSWRKPRIRRLW
jgi:hypothetical protein